MKALEVVEKLGKLFLIFTLSGCTTTQPESMHAIAIKRHVYITDPQQYGVENKWRVSLRGDCEDYALWMRERLGGNLLVVWQITGRKYTPHMVLDVNGTIIDNTSKVTYPRSEMKHKFWYQVTEQQIKENLERDR